MIKKSDLKLVSAEDVAKMGKPNPYVFEGEDKENAPSIANMLFSRMQEIGSIGLSATQVGLNMRVFVMGTESVRVNAFNPEIIEMSEETEVASEGCVVYPGLSLNLKRPKTITARFQNEKGELCELTISGLTARIFLHQMDFMEGRDFKDNASPLKLQFAKKKQKNRQDKIVKKYAQKILRGQVGK